MQLENVKSRVERALTAGTVDAYTKAHLSEVAERFDKAMEAGLEVEMMGGRRSALGFEQQGDIDLCSEGPAKRSAGFAGLSVFSWSENPDPAAAGQNLG